MSTEERPPRVLIVDDERHNRQLLEVMLAREGFELSSAATGEEALSMIAVHPPDLILLDVMMPGLDGYQVVTQLKHAHATKNIPVILITALDDRDARLLGLNAGAEDFLSKPVDRAELCARVRNLLRLKAYADYHDRYGKKLEGEVGSRTAEIVEGERLYRETFDAAPVGILHVGLDGNWLRVNQRFCDLVGYTREELQTTAVQKIVRAHAGDEDAAREETEILSTLASGTTLRHVIDERRFGHRDGRFIYGRVNISVHRDADGKPRHFISVVEDITDSRALEARVRQTSKMDAIGRLASGIAHDFNNLLTVVLGYSEMIAEDLPVDSTIRADLGQIRGAGLRAADLTRQLLAFSRRQVLRPHSVDLGEVLSGVQGMLTRVLGEDVELTTDLAPDLGMILVDPGQMEQVIMNLAVNARDAMPLGGRLTMRTSNVVLEAADVAQNHGLTPGSHVMLAVGDNGIGMDAATQACMFEPFFTTKEAGKGTGLGLATVFGIVRQSGGGIAVTSAVGVGSEFRVYFPTVDADLLDDEVPTGVEIVGFQGQETVLVVEDDDRVRMLAGAILRRFGYTVLEAASGADAIEACEQHSSPIHLLLTDVVMPRMSGRQLAERAAPFRPKMRVLYMSGYLDDAVVRHGIEDASIAFLQKPFTPDSLTRKVRQTLAD